MTAFAVFGNPIEHSKSADIYKLFADEMNIPNKYDLKLVSEGDFDYVLHDFFDSGGLGANITVPFKERAFLLCNHLTERAVVAKSVNTIKKNNDNTLLGDNTDGIGLINDLKRLFWISQDNMLKRVLLIGSGGAAKGIIPILLEELPGCYINIVNRSFINAQKLVHYYHKIGRQNISCIDLNSFLYESCNKKYNLIINASSSSMCNDIPKIPSFFITTRTRCYDLFYQSGDTIFIRWCKLHGANYCSDGLGMLVEQAAYSFYFWHNRFPSTAPVLHYLRAII